MKAVSLPPAPDPQPGQEPPAATLARRFVRHRRRLGCQSRWSRRLGCGFVTVLVLASGCEVVSEYWCWCRCRCWCSSSLLIPRGRVSGMRERAAGARGRACASGRHEQRVKTGPVPLDLVRVVRHQQTLNGCPRRLRLGPPLSEVRPQPLQIGPFVRISHQLGQLDRIEHTARDGGPLPGVPALVQQLTDAPAPPVARTPVLPRLQTGPQRPGEPSGEQSRFPGGEGPQFLGQIEPYDRAIAIEIEPHRHDEPRPGQLREASRADRHQRRPLGRAHGPHPLAQGVRESLRRPQTVDLQARDLPSAQGHPGGRAGGRRDDAGHGTDVPELRGELELAAPQLQFPRGPVGADGPWHFPRGLHRLGCRGQGGRVRCPGVVVPGL